MIEIENIKRKAFSGAIWKALERICAQLVSLIVSIIIARILTPDDYSVVGIVSIFFTFCNVLISGGFNTALIQKKDSDIYDYSSVLLVTMIVSTILYIIIFFTAPLIANLYNKDILTLIFRIMGLTFFINAFKSVLCAYISNNLQFKKFFYATIIGTIISAFVGIIMALKGFGPWALVAQQMTNSFIDTVVLYFITKLKFIFKISLNRIKSLFSYGGKMFLASIISTTYDEIKPLIVGIKYSTQDLAFFNKGKSFPKLIDSSITDTIASVLFPVISKFQDSKEMVLEVTRKYMKISSYIIFPSIIGFAVISNNFTQVVLTEKWMPIVPYINIFSFGCLLNIVQVGHLQAIRAIGRSDIFLKLEIIKKTLYFITIFIFICFSNSPYVLAFSEIICAIIATTVNSRPNRNLIGYSYKYQLMDLLPNLLLASFMGIAVYFIGTINLNKTLILIIQVLSGIIIYLVISLLTKNKNLKYLNEIIKSKLK